MYGVSRYSVLCDSRYCHVVDGLPGDAMHDVLEGVLLYQCKEMLKEFIFKEKYFTLEQLIKRCAVSIMGILMTKTSHHQLPSKP